jgi:hypothetical protein
MREEELKGKYAKKHKVKIEADTTIHSAPVDIEPCVEPSHPKQEKTGDKRTKKNRFSMRKPDAFDVALYGLIIAFIGGGIYFLQLRVMQNQLEAMNAQLGLERPWVGPVGGSPLHFDATTKRFLGIDWRYQNGGRSPALHTRASVGFVSGPPYSALAEFNTPKLPDCANFPKDTEGGDVMIPGLEPPVIVLSVPPEINMDDVYSNKKGLFLIGCIYYTDTAMKKWYKTDVAEIFRPNFNLGAFQTLKWGNDAN